MDIRTRILTRRDLDDLRAARDIDAMAAALNAEGLMAPVPTLITARGVRSVLSVVDAAKFLLLFKSLRDATELPANIAAVLDQMGVSPDEHFAYLDTFASAHDWLQQGSGLDVGADRARQMMDVTAVADPAKFGTAVATLKAMAMRLVIVDRLEVYDALYNLDGSEK